MLPRFARADAATLMQMLIFFAYVSLYTCYELMRAADTDATLRHCFHLRDVTVRRGCHYYCADMPLMLRACATALPIDCAITMLVDTCWRQKRMPRYATEAMMRRALPLFSCRCRADAILPPPHTRCAILLRAF
jgi:hypothetical protein